MPESSHEWPLLGRTNQSHEVLSRRRERNMSVVEWVMSLHSRSSSIGSHTNSTESSLDRESDNCLCNDFKIEGRIRSTEYESTDGSRSLIYGETSEKPSALEEACMVSEGISIDQKDEFTSTVVYGWPLRRISAPMISGSSNCKQFSYEELKQATCHFSSDNLIGEGGCSNVYKGCLSDGKQWAVKVLKSYKEAWNDFCLEVDITSSLKHKSITTLVGVCTEDNNLISVNEFLPKGSLEESLHGKQSVLPWEVRFEVAVATAEALNYLHNECPRPVIHRDVKSSNILLSNEFQPQLSDFGFAVWGPTDSTYVIHEDVVGTFGYIAPEYFMHGKVSDKIDVYSYGVVLLELLSGRGPIGSKNLKGSQESLIKWAKPMLKNGDAEALLDPKLNKDYCKAQMQRMVLAASLCINQSPRLRPNMSQILLLLRGETDAKEWTGNQDDDDDDFQDLGDKPHLDFSILDINFDAISLTSIDGTSQSHFVTEKKKHLKLRDYLKEEQD